MKHFLIRTGRSATPKWTKHIAHDGNTSMCGLAYASNGIPADAPGTQGPIKTCKRCEHGLANPDVIVTRLAPGFFMISAGTRRGLKWMQANVQGVEDGSAPCDDTRFARDIYEGAKAEGLRVVAEVR